LANEEFERILKEAVVTLSRKNPRNFIGKLKKIAKQLSYDVKFPG
jgi:hypothetical protein